MLKPYICQENVNSTLETSCVYDSPDYVSQLTKRIIMKLAYASISNLTRFMKRCCSDVSFYLDESLYIDKMTFLRKFCHT